MTNAGSEIYRQFQRGQVRIALDLPKGEKLKNARAQLSVGGNTLADVKLKTGTKSLSYYSRPGEAVSLTIKGKLRKDRANFSERFELKGGQSDPTTVKLSFAKPDKPAKAGKKKPDDGLAMETKPATASADVA
jgi:hypothetical protein